MSDALRLTVYFGESDRVGGALLSDALMEIAGREGLVASALLRGVEGFGIKHRLRSDRLLSLSEDLPLVAVAVDRPARILALARALAPLLGDGLLTLERAIIADERPGEGLRGPAGAEAKLTVWCGRGGEGRPAPLAIVSALRAAGLPGATVLTGLDGTIRGLRHRARLLSRNPDVPALVVSVGPLALLRRALPRLRGIAGRHVAVLERVRIVRQEGGPLAAMPPAPARDGEGLALWRRVEILAGEQARLDGQALHVALIRRLRRAGASGATALRGAWGYSGAGPLHGDRLLAIGRRTPILVTAVEQVEREGYLWPLLEEATAAAGLVTCELVPAYHAVVDGRVVGGLRLAATEV